MQLLVSSIDYNDYVGRIGVGRVENGTIRVGQEVALCNYHNPDYKKKTKVVSLYQFDGLKRVNCESAAPGNKPKVKSEKAMLRINPT